MIKIIRAPRGEELKEIHRQIEVEYNEMIELTGGKKKMEILDKLANKYGYSSGQSIRNILNGNAKNK